MIKTASKAEKYIMQNFRVKRNYLKAQTRLRVLEDLVNKSPEHAENLPKTSTFYVEDNKAQCAETNSDMKNLLAEKSRLDFASFINGISDVYSGADSDSSTTKLYLDPPSPQNINDGDTLFRRLCTDEVKMEPVSPPSSPAPIEQEKINLQSRFLHL